MSGSKPIDYQQDESAFAYPGWRVAIASGVGVFVSFGSLLVYTFGIFLKPVTAEFGWMAVKLSIVTLFAAGLMLGMPAYRAYADRSMAASAR